MLIHAENIPKLLKETGRFCCWRYKTVKGRKTKVPYDPVTGHGARANDPSTFRDYETAATATGYDGIGIRVCGGIVGIDLDHCIEDGRPLPWAKEIMDRFSGTYSEISPSGAGARIFCLLPDGFAYDPKTYYIKKGNIEVYIPGQTNRFLTVTGSALNSADVTETAEALRWLLDTYMRRPIQPVSQTPAPGGFLSDDSVITKASGAVNGEKFQRLWNGDTTGFASHSEADIALCSMLAFWCGGDREQMDRLFRQSGLMRDKWDAYRGAETYGDLTVTKALSCVTSFYSPIPGSSAAEDFGMERLAELDPMDAVKYPWNDIGAGHIFADYFCDRLRYVPERKMWFFYDDGVWQPDTGSLRAMKYCMELANLMYTFALEIRDEDKRKAYMKYASRWQSHNNRVSLTKIQYRRLWMYYVEGMSETEIARREGVGQRRISTSISDGKKNVEKFI